MTLVVITLAKNDLFGLMRTEQSIVKQTVKPKWVIVTPIAANETYTYAKTLVSNGLASSLILDPGNGTYAAMNKAINDSSSLDHIWFINSGDELAFPESYQIVENEIADSDNLWFFGGHILGSSSGEILGRVPPPRKFSRASQLFANRYISHQSTIFRNQFIRDLGGFDESLKIAADWDLMCKASLLEKPRRIERELSIFYMGGLSTEYRQKGNTELLRLRRKYLPRGYFTLSLLWFWYRWIRNSVVRLLEVSNPGTADRIRTLRMRLKSFKKKGSLNE